MSVLELVLGVVFMKNIVTTNDTITLLRNHKNYRHSIVPVRFIGKSAMIISSIIIALKGFKGGNRVSTSLPLLKPIGIVF